MAIPESGNISIKGAAGSGRSIDAEQTGVSSGSLVTLSTSGVITSGNDIDGSTPHAMSEFYGYQHTIPPWSTTGSVDQQPVGKTVRWVLDLSDPTPDNVGGTIEDMATWPGGTGLRIWWTALITGWVSLRIGPTSSSYTTLARSAMTADGNLHYIADGNTYITNTNNATMYFELLT